MVTTPYTEADQRADTAFLVGVAHGRRAQAERIAQAIEAIRTHDAGVRACIERAARIARESA